MKKVTVTSELKKSIEKVTGNALKERVYSDSRKNKTAVGVKVCYAQYSDPIKNQIIDDMESKGYKLDYVRYNQSNGGNPYAWRSIPGTRFCFYKK